MKALLRSASFLALLLATGSALASLPALAQRDGMPTLAPMLAQVTPAVVNIAVEQRSPEAQNPLLRDPFFRRFFGLPDRPQRQMSAGSGVIVDAAKGYVITNHHVIKGASAVMVTLKDNRTLPAKLVGSDAGTDIAVLQVQPGNLTAARFGDSDVLEVGDFVVAIGNPFGIGQTVTSGIVSALGRSGLSQEAFEDFIQTDASINPGNSGGALVNLKGELIGINTAIIGPSGGNVGIGFAVPANMVRAVMQQIAKFGEVRRGRLGIVMQDLTPDLARSLGSSINVGAVLSEVQPDSPAAQAGLRVGDVVMALNGRPVHAAAELRARLGVIPAGETVEMRIQRGGETRTLRARIAEIESREAGAGQSVPELAGAALADGERRTRTGRGRVIVVTAVEASSPAFGHGLRAGDLLIGVNSRRIGTVAELAKLVRGSERVALNVLRGDFLLTIVIRA